VKCRLQSQDTASASFTCQSKGFPIPIVRLILIVSTNFEYLLLYLYQKSDSICQGGLAAILGPKPSSDPAQILDLTLRAQCFYFSRKKSIPVDFNGYKTYLASKSSAVPETSLHATQEPTMAIQTPPQNDQGTTLPPTSTSTTGAPPPHPANFQQIVALIQSGQPIPGIMVSYLIESAVLDFHVTLKFKE
jgi:hypothetical protein